MNPALWVAKTGLDAQHNRLRVTANNLANASTVGFKKDRAVFEDLIYQNVRQAGAQASQSTTLPSGLNYGTGVRIVATEKIHQQGNIYNTENPLDMAVQGKGFFQVLRPDGSIGYTRDGSFQVNENGEIVTANGDPLDPSITIPADTVSLTIGTDGTVSALQAGATSPTTVGNIQLADFINPTGLQAIGDNLYLETLASGTPTINTPGQSGTGTLLSGSLESSNVNVVEELVNMIETQRTFEMNSKAVSTADQMLQYISNNL